MLKHIRIFLPTVICGLTVLLAAARAQAQNELRCRGGKKAFVFDHVNQNTLSLSFVASTRAAGATGQDLDQGTCAWVDRALSDGESRQIQFVVAALDAISIPDYLDDSTHYWTFLVTSTSKDHFESKGHGGLTNANAVASPGRIPKASPGGISSASSGGIPNTSLGGIPNPSPGGIPNASPGGIPNASPGGIVGDPTRGSLAAKLKGKLRRLALDTARVSQIDKLIRGDAKSGEQTSEDADLPVIRDVAAALADQSVIFSFKTQPNSLPLVELAPTPPVLGADKRWGFQVGPGLVAHPAAGDSASGEYWVDMNHELKPAEIYYYIISVWKDNNPNAPRRQVTGNFRMPAAEQAQPSEIIPP